MKKLLVLTLVLGLATVVSAVPASDLADIAGMDYTVVGNTVTILSTAGVANFSLGQITPDTGTLTVGTVPSTFNAVAGDGMADLAGTGIMGVSGAVSGTPPAYVTGTMYTFTYAGGTLLITLEDSFLGESSVQWETDAVTSLTGATITIPEPMTIALLGLGGLFLRRKK